MINNLRTTQASFTNRIASFSPPAWAEEVDEAQPGLLEVRILRGPAYLPRHLGDRQDHHYPDRLRGLA